jgi:alginate O-acetyltransferase complex protein AlgI
MLFHTLDFAVFLPVVFFLYWITAKKLKLQNALVVVASYVFYGWWDWRFLSLMAFSTLVDYLVGIALSRTGQQKKRKLLLATSLVVNLGLLGLFKYFNFFIDNFTTAFSFFGWNISPTSLNIILPVGISFYTFQTLSYSIDVYRGSLKPTKDFVAFAAFVSFFPQLVAGPIERASNLLPQFQSKRKFDADKAIDGLHLMIWGLFKKIVIADSCAEYANEIFSKPEKMNSISLVVGAIYFAFQIYGDFSGYSDIARGISKMLGIDLMRNFRVPYFSRDMAEFWRRWHISLSTWFRDYVYIPLGGSKGNKWNAVRNTVIVFLVSGFWHGANWTFIAWGAINALYFIPLLLLGRNRVHIDGIAEGRTFPSFKELFHLVSTFILICFSWIFFRAASVTDAIFYIKRMVSLDMKGGVQFLSIERYAPELVLLLIVFLTIEWKARDKEHPFMGSFKSFRLALVILMLITLGVYADSRDFIYFQF